jgi:hypothetical protein
VNAICDAVFGDNGERGGDGCGERYSKRTCECTRDYGACREDGDIGAFGRSAFGFVLWMNWVSLEVS